MGWLVVALALASNPGTKVEFVQGTTSSRTDDLEVRAGGLVVREGEPGSAFGCVQVGKAKRQLSYFVIFQHALAREGQMEWSEETTMDGNSASSKQRVAVEGKSIQIDYNIEIDDRTLKIAKESLSINGKAVDISRGRVFLVDLKSNESTWTQRKSNLPDEVKEAATKKEAEELVHKVLTGLTKQDDKVKDFLAAARK